jgi:ABC-type Zn uptake system ZnuABC Zn-binding protein ZnuA
MRMTFTRAVLLAAMAAASILPAKAQEDGLLVVTSLQAIYALTSALVEGTPIRVENAPADGALMADHARILADDDLDALLADADAVVSIVRLWREDPLYAEARARNIRVVPIDAARPYDEVTQPVGLRKYPCQPPEWGAAASCPEDFSPYVWFSIANGVRIAENIATDLKRLSPDAAATIDTNLATILRELRTLQAEYDGKFAALADPRVFALADEFVYLFDEMGIYVDGYFTREDVRWSEADLAGFDAYLKEAGPTVIVHKWEPAEPIKAIIEANGARLVILNTLDPGLEVGGRLSPDGYVTLLRQNLDALLAALSEN